MQGLNKLLTPSMIALAIKMQNPRHYVPQGIYQYTYTEIGYASLYSLACRGSYWISCAAMHHSSYV